MSVEHNTRPLPPVLEFGKGNFKDTGCFDGEHPSCLRCPLLFCKYDTVQRDSRPAPTTVTHRVTGVAGYWARFPDAMRLAESGVTPREIARVTGVSLWQARRVSGIVNKSRRQS